MGSKRKRGELKLASLPFSSPYSSSSSSSPSLRKKREVKWAQHYSSSQYLLLVGEGDFSFSLSLATTFASAANIVATSYDSHDALLAKYGKAKENLELLQSLGAKILHEIDAATMDLHNELKTHQFDRIIFNFPHAGFIGKEEQLNVIILHRQLVSGFFRAAAKMLRPDGEIHVAHKIGNPYDQWNLEELAAGRALQLIECSRFQLRDYPGYNNKRGAGSWPDLPFILGACRTFKFKAYDLSRRMNSSLLTRRIQPSARMELNGEEILERNHQHFPVPGDYCVLPRIERNCISEAYNICRNHILEMPLNDLQRSNLVKLQLAYQSLLNNFSSM